MAQSTYDLPDVGLTKILNLLASGLYLAVGTGTTTPAAGDTTLEGEIARVAVLTYTVVAATSIQFEAFFTSGLVGGQTIQKVGLFDAAAAGNLVAQQRQTLIVAVGNGAIVSLTLPIGRTP